MGWAVIVTGASTTRSAQCLYETLMAYLYHLCPMNCQQITDSLTFSLAAIRK